MHTYLFENQKISFPDDKAEMKTTFLEMLTSKNQKKISFINPEIFLAQQKNLWLADYLQRMDYNFVDGIGLLKAINKKCETTYTYKNRMPGTDFFDYMPNERVTKVFLFGAKEERGNDAVKKISEKYKNVQVVGYIDGYTKIPNADICAKINESGAEIVIVCLGCPRQEFWVDKNSANLNAKIIFANGGAIDFWSGKTKRAPKIFIKLGIEWLFRLFASFSFERFARQTKLLKFLAKYRLRCYEIKEL